MNINDNDFFREATLRICGSLEIEKALHSCLQFLQKSMPLDRVFLQCFDENRGAMRTIATATASECSALDLLTPLSEEARSCDHEELPESHGVCIFDNPNKHIISREMLSFHEVPCTSLMVVLLKSEEQIVGHLVCITEGKQKFTAEHARLISWLKDPFTIALSNTLKHRNELKLYDRNFFWEATMRICSSLNIETALWHSLIFLQDYIPAEEAALLYFDPDKGTVTLNAHADGSEGRLVNLQVAYPQEVRASMEDVTQLEDFIENRAEEHPVAKPILLALGKDKSSLIVVRLIVERRWMGSVVLWAHGWDRFNDEHLRLLKQLKQPFFIALSNSRRYRELLELKELLADDNR